MFLEDENVPLVLGGLTKDSKFCDEWGRRAKRCLKGSSLNYSAPGFYTNQVHV